MHMDLVLLIAALLVLNFVVLPRIPGISRFT